MLGDKFGQLLLAGNEEGKADILPANWKLSITASTDYKGLTQKSEAERDHLVSTHSNSSDSVVQPDQL